MDLACITTRRKEKIEKRKEKRKKAKKIGKQSTVDKDKSKPRDARIQPNQTKQNNTDRHKPNITPRGRLVRVHKPSPFVLCLIEAIRMDGRGLKDGWTRGRSSVSVSCCRWVNIHRRRSRCAQASLSIPRIIIYPLPPPLESVGQLSHLNRKRGGKRKKPTV